MTANKYPEEFEIELIRSATKRFTALMQIVKNCKISLKQGVTYG